MEQLSNLVEIIKGNKITEVFSRPHPNTHRYIQIEDLRPGSVPKYAHDKDAVLATKNDVLIAWDGANAGTVGFNLEGYPGSTIAILRPKNRSKIYGPFLGYFLQSQFKYIQDNCTGATIPHVSRSSLEVLRLHIPPFLEQKRIAAILEKADRLRRLRRYALELSSTYLQSVFLEMFSKNADTHWPNESIESLAQGKKGAIRTGPFGSQLLHSEFVKEGIAVLGIDNAVQNRFEWGARRFITEEKYQELKRYRVFPGDVIITIMGTPGRCAVIPENILLAINTKHLCCITLDQSRCLPTYLKFCFLTHPSALRQLNVSERGAVMPGLNMEIIKELIVPCPPITLQQKFTEIVQKFERLQAQQREAERQAEHLFQTLLHKVFQGELASNEDEVLIPDVEIVNQQKPVFADIAEPINGDAYQLALPME